MSALHANVIAPGKRMLSSMTPTMVLKDGKLVLVTGSPGGRTIINTVFTIVLGVVEYGLTGREAVDLARMHHQWLPDRVTIEKDHRPPRQCSRSSKRWDIDHRRQANARETRHSIWIAPDGSVYGVQEKRTPDGKASVPPGLTSPAAGR